MNAETTRAPGRPMGSRNKPKPVQAKEDVVSPRRINVMAGDYEPRLMPPSRPGALDYQRCASHGVRC